MRVLFIPWGQATHYLHLVPLAWAFSTAGHEVRVATQPGAAAAVSNSGMAFACVAQDYDFAPGTQQIDNDIRKNLPLLRQMISGDPSGARRLIQEWEKGNTGKLHATVLAKWRESVQGTLAPYIRAAEAMADDLVKLVRAWPPDLVIADPFILAAPLAAEQAGARLIHHQWGPAIHRHVGVFPVNGLPGGLWPDDLCRLFDRFGVEPRAEHAAATVDPCPGSLQYPVIPDRIPARYVPYNGPGEAPSWLLDPPRRRRVAVTWGTLTTIIAGREGFLVPRVLEVLAGFDTEVVVTLNPADRALLPPGSERDGVRIVQNLPLHLLMPSCDAIVHQGGAGAMLTAAALGVPQVLITGMLDQAANASRITAAGAGTGLHWAQASQEAIGAAISAALSDGKREAAARLSQEIQAQPAPAQIVGTLTGLTQGALA